MMSTNRKSYLVAGGSSGLGAACVRRLVATGRCGVNADLKPPEELFLEGTENRFIYCPTDVTNEAAVSTALAMARDRFGPLRGAVICSGILNGEKIIDANGVADLNGFRRVVEVNLVGTFNVLRLAARAMQDNEPNREGQRGVIVMTASTAAYEGQIGQAAYAASKGGVVALTLPAARELGRYGIRVVTIAPGVFDTPMMQPVPDKFKQSLQAQIPFPPRFGRPEEFAALVEHILANPMLNGEVIRLDGGLRMGAR